jgi:hypothetical protein
MSCEDTLIKHGDQLFSKREPLLSLWQEISELTYPERADFTTTRNIGEEMAKGLMTSAPVIMRRDLGNSFSAMLRPTAKDWFRMKTRRPETESHEAKQWLEWASKYTKNLMYDRRAQFTRATKEADHDFAAFGQCVISTELNPSRDGLLYRCWHLRDVVWCEDATGKISTIHRKWKPTVRDLVALFGKDKLHANVLKKLEKEPYAEIEVRHVVMPAGEYMETDKDAEAEGETFRTPYVSCYIDVENKHEMECVGSWTSHYTIPRWQTVSGSQYAHSPAVVAALPDARLLQDVTRTLLEAGEKAVNPPMLAVQEAIRGDVSIYAGGITWVDAEYDERLGEVLRPLTQEKGGLAFGMEMVQDIRLQLADAFYLSKLNLPPTGGPDMTAYEVGQRVQEFIRNALPLFEPMEMDYNGQICEASFELLLRNEPSVRKSIPRELQGKDIEFAFESPLRDATEKIKIGQYLEAQQILAAAIQLDPSVALIVDNDKATRDVLGAAVPAAWLRSQGDVDKMKAQQAAQAQTQQLLAVMQQGADVAKTLKEASPTVGQGGAGGVL